MTYTVAIEVTEDEAGRLGRWVDMLRVDMLRVAGVQSIADELAQRVWNALPVSAGLTTEENTQ